MAQWVESTCSTADSGWIHGLGRFPWRRAWQPTPCHILAWRIPMDRGAWQAAVHGVTELDMTKLLSTAQHGT